MFRSAVLCFMLLAALFTAGNVQAQVYYAVPNPVALPYYSPRVSGYYSSPAPYGYYGQGSIAINTVSVPAKGTGSRRLLSGIEEPPALRLFATRVR